MFGGLTCLGQICYLINSTFDIDFFCPHSKYQTVTSPLEFKAFHIESALIYYLETLG